jgi:hypothetical protein
MTDTATQITAKLAELSQIDLAKVDAYERRHENRTPIVTREYECAHEARAGVLEATERELSNA